MKNGIRHLLSLLVLGSLTLTFLPESGKCQMLYGGVLASSCQMACCKAKMPMPHCPMLKATVPKDFIASSGLIFEAGLQPLSSLIIQTQPPLRLFSAAFSEIADTFELLFLEPAGPVRAPPSDVHLLAA